MIRVISASFYDENDYSMEFGKFYYILLKSRTKISDPHLTFRLSSHCLKFKT